MRPVAQSSRAAPPAAGRNSRPGRSAPSARPGPDAWPAREAARPGPSPRPAGWRPGHGAAAAAGPGREPPAARPGHPAGWPGQAWTSTRSSATRSNPMVQQAQKQIRFAGPSRSEKQYALTPRGRRNSRAVASEPRCEPPRPGKEVDIAKFYSGFRPTGTRQRRNAAIWAYYAMGYGPTLYCGPNAAV